MGKVKCGVNVRPIQINAVGTVNLADMTLEMGDNGTDTIQEIFSKFDGKLVKVTFEEVNE